MIREAAVDDRDLVHALGREFEAEVPDLPWRDDDEAPDGSDLVLLAGDAGLSRPRPRRGAAARGARPRGRGLGQELLRELEVIESNDAARKLYDGLGFRTVERHLALHIGAAAGDGPSYGAVHVQDDDVDTVGRNAEKVLRKPDRLRTLARELSFTSGVAVAVGVESGAVVRYVLFDRGSVVDEYASVPEFHGPLPPADELYRQICELLGVEC